MKTLADIDPDAKGVPYAIWKARQLNRLFEHEGLQKQAGKILPPTVEDGLKKYSPQQRRRGPSQ
jgi:hypothetical protein